LYGFFPLYWAITGEGGKLYSPFLDHYFNIIKGLTTFLTGAARLVLQAFHYTVHQNNYHTLRIEYSKGISVNPSCLGWAVMSFWVAFVFANGGIWKHKLKWMMYGIASICILNITRIALIAAATHLRWKTIASLDHHQLFNVFSYCCIFILMYLYTRVQKKYEGNKLKPKQQKNKLSAV
jgi:exosortase/archaeosortase family protein